MTVHQGSSLALKKIKSITSMEFTAEQPRTFWNTVVSHGDDWIVNVDQQVPHPRWSQATEWMIGPDERVPAQYLNGDEQWVAP